jgi:DNA (cytosine-5)-methyltransferase 1
MEYATIDLCAGIGGIRRGFELTGHFHNKLSAEIDKFACITYEHLFQENPFNDITTNEFKRVADNTDYDVLLAGFPCQTFSRAGLQEGFGNQEKGVIFFHIADIIKRTRPKAFLLENVDHLFTHNKGKTFNLIIEKLEEELNYKIVGITHKRDGQKTYSYKDFVRNSKDFGVPQNRPRVYIIGFDRSRYGEDSLKIIANELPKSCSQTLYNNLGEVLEMKAEPKYYLASGYLETLYRHKERQRQMGNGFGYMVVNTGDITKAIANTLLATGGSGRERNLVNDPQKGIGGMRLPPKRTPLNDKGIRMMTPREWGKLQGFINYAYIYDGKDTFNFPDKISDMQKYKQFGNSVTIPVIKSMADFIHECLCMLDS